MCHASNCLRSVARPANFPSSSFRKVIFRCAQWCVSSRGNRKRSRPILEVCNEAKPLCATGYPGIAVSVAVDGKLNFDLATHVPGATGPMAHCMDRSIWDDAEGWQSESALMTLSSCIPAAARAFGSTMPIKNPSFVKVMNWPAKISASAAR